MQNDNEKARIKNEELEIDSLHYYRQIRDLINESFEDIPWKRDYYMFLNNELDDANKQVRNQLLKGQDKLEYENRILYERINECEMASKKQILGEEDI